VLRLAAIDLPALVVDKANPTGAPTRRRAIIPIGAITLDGEAGSALDYARAVLKAPR
jgi:hypothetical protein